MIYRTIMILTFALLLPFGLGCDNDNNSNAQDMDEPGTMIDCPCFTKQDVLNMGKNSTAVVCDITNWALLLEFQGDEVFEANMFCNSDGTGCTCGSGKPPNVSFTDTSAPEATVCMEVLINSLVQSALDGGIMVNDCTFEL